MDQEPTRWEATDEVHVHATEDLARMAHPRRDVSIEFTFTIEDPELYSRLVDPPAFEGEILGGPLDGLPVRIWPRAPRRPL